MKPLVMLFIVALGMLRAIAADVVIRAGAAQADITPEPEVLNWITGKPYGEVADRLSVHVLVLDDGATRAAIVRWDLVDVSESARDEVRRALQGACGIPGENILVNASHNHSAPWAPVYAGTHRGKERDTWWAVRHMPAQNEFPPFKRWMERLIRATTDAAKEATAALRPVGLSITRVAAGDFLHNRRPRAPRWGITDPKPGAGVTPASPQWQPEVLQGGATFGPLDRTLSLVSLREPSGATVASLLHLACHAVSIYPSDPRLSSDWPGPAVRAIREVLGGEVLFLQGCTGDINPWRRGAAAVAEMAVGLRRKVELALPYRVGLKPEPIRVGRTTIRLPLTPAAQKRVGADTVEAEIQAIVCGPLALVALPGEPMTELNLFIRERSPFPQTLVLGYSNGNGVHYVGMPGEKARGGYETTDAGAGTDDCGRLILDAAVQVLEGLYRQRDQRAVN